MRPSKSGSPNVIPRTRTMQREKLPQVALWVPHVQRHKSAPLTLKWICVRRKGKFKQKKLLDGMQEL